MGMDIRMKTSGIYKIVNKVNGRYYVGSSRDIHSRWIKHQKELTNRTHHNSHLTNAWHKYGRDSFEITLLEEVPIDKLYEAEQVYLDICAANPSEAYNANYAPDGGRPSEESIRKISQKLKGRVFTEEHKRKIGQAMVGRPYSQETREKIGRYSATRVHSAETRRKIGVASLGHKLSDEVKARIGASNIGKHNVPRDKVVRMFRNQRTGEIFEGIRHTLVERFGLDSASVSNLIHGKIMSVKGWCLATSHYEMRGAA